MTVLITLTTAGTDSGPFDLYSDIDGYTSAFETGVSKASLLAGYASALVPDYTTIIRVKSNGNCVNYININLYGTTTTSTTPSPFYRCIRLDGCDGFGYRDVVYNPLFVYGNTAHRERLTGRPSTRISKCSFIKTSPKR